MSEPTIEQNPATDEDVASAVLQEWGAMVAEMGDLLAAKEYFKLETLVDFFRASVKDSRDAFGMLSVNELNQILARRGVSGS